MKTNWKALSVLTGGLALSVAGQEALSTSPPSAGAQYGVTSSARGVAGGGGFGGAAGSTANFGARLAGVVARASGSGQNTAIYFESGSEKEMDEMAEDLQVLEYLISRNIDRAMGEHATQYRLGVPMLLRGEGRAVQASYLQGFGALVKINAPFAVAGSSEEGQKRKEIATAQTEWEKARRAVKGAEGDNDGGEGDAGNYDARLVAALKKEIFESLKNASHLRHVKDDEWIAVVVSGGAGAGTRSVMNSYGGYGNGTAGLAAAPVEVAAGRPKPSMLTIRVKKSAASGSASEIEKSAQILSYFDPATAGADSVARRRTTGVPTSTAR